MSGIFLIAIVGLWVWLVFKFSRFIGKQVAGNRWGSLVTVLLFLVLLPLPVVDEIIGGFQFRALCAKNASAFRVGVRDPQGRTTKVTVDPANQYLDSVAIPIRYSQDVYSDATTQERVVAVDQYVAEGGLLIRALGISENNSPLTIGRPACSPEQARGESARLTFKLNVIN